MSSTETTTSNGIYIDNKCYYDSATHKQLSNFHFTMTKRVDHDCIKVMLEHRQGWMVERVLSPAGVTAEKLNREILASGLMGRCFVFGGTDQQLQSILKALPEPTKT